MRPNELNRPLTRGELRELRSILESTPSAMSLPEADGFLTGVCSAPQMLMPSTWCPVLLGDRTSESLEEAERCFGLLMRLYNQVSTGLDKGQPIRPSRALDDEQLSEWCRGYLVATDMDVVWKNDESAVEDLRPFHELAGKGEEEADGQISGDTDTRFSQYGDSLPARVVEIYEFWCAKRRTGSSEKLSKPNKVGRNERCPCGSGLKYKKCCAD